MTDWLLPFFCGLGAAVIAAWGVGGGTLLRRPFGIYLLLSGVSLIFPQKQKRNPGG